jgi:hypothetical protein
MKRKWGGGGDGVGGGDVRPLSGPDNGVILEWLNVVGNCMRASDL